jgi:hypothetical protein
MIHIHVAAATHLGSYISGFDSIPSNGITKDDEHRKMYELESRIESEEKYQVEIHAVCNSDGRELRWFRSLHGKDGRTHIGAAKEIMEYSSELQQTISVLPEQADNIQIVWIRLPMTN